MWAMKSDCSTKYEPLMITSNAHTKMHVPADTGHMVTQSVAYSNV
jgi:hypothetical protein